MYTAPREGCLRPFDMPEVSEGKAELRPSRTNKRNCHRAKLPLPTRKTNTRLKAIVEGLLWKASCGAGKSAASGFDGPTIWFSVRSLQVVPHDATHEAERCYLREHVQALSRPVRVISRELAGGKCYRVYAEGKRSTLII